MKDIDRLKEVLKTFNESFTEGIYDARIELSDNTIELHNKFNEHVIFRFDEASGKYNGFEVYE